MIKLLTPQISDAGLDSRGSIYSYVPESAVVEFCYISTGPGSVRGQHQHKEFDEYIMLTEGEGVYIETLPDGSHKKTLIGPGQCVYIPANTYHTFFPVTACKSVSLLTKRWDHCKEPITRSTL